jgi:hypothetical protein
VVIIVLVLAGRHKAATPTTINRRRLCGEPAVVAARDGESTSLSGGKSTFIDGHQNTGKDRHRHHRAGDLSQRRSDAAPDRNPAAFFGEPMTYVDTSPSVRPRLKRRRADFRLIFESLPANWNMQMPEIRIIQVDTK